MQDISNDMVSAIDSLRSSSGNLSGSEARGMLQDVLFNTENPNNVRDLLCTKDKADVSFTLDADGVWDKETVFLGGENALERLEAACTAHWGIPVEFGPDVSI